MVHFKMTRSYGLRTLMTHLIKNWIKLILMRKPQKALQSGHHQKNHQRHMIATLLSTVQILQPVPTTIPRSVTKVLILMNNMARACVVHVYTK